MKWKRGILICLSIISACVIGEIYIRTYYPQTTLARAKIFSFACFEEGKYRWVKLAANKTCPLRSLVGNFPDTTVITSSLGLRNPEIPIQKPADTTRILFVGDSMTMGWGVDEQKAYPRFVESLIRERYLDKKVEAINAGFAASGPSGYYLYIKNYGMQLSPDIVVIGLTMGNDITARQDVEWVEKDTNGLPKVIRSKTTYVDHEGRLRRTNLPIKYRFPLLRDSHLFIFIINLLIPEDVHASVEITKLNPNLCLYKPSCHDLDIAKAEVRAVLRGIRDIVEAHHAKLLVALLPSDVSVNEYGWYTEGLPIPLTPSERRYPHTSFVASLAEDGIESIDLLPKFLENADTQLYFEKDDHFNSIGHELTAKAITNKLSEYFTSRP